MKDEERMRNRHRAEGTEQPQRSNARCVTACSPGQKQDTEGKLMKLDKCLFFS